MDPLAMVIDRDREFLLGGFLPDDVLIQEFFYFEGLGKFVRTGGGSLGPVVFQDRVTDRNTFVTYVCPRIIAGGRYQFPDNVLTLMTKRTAKSLVRSCTLHAYLP